MVPIGLGIASQSADGTDMLTRKHRTIDKYINIPAGDSPLFRYAFKIAKVGSSLLQYHISCAKKCATSLLKDQRHCQVLISTQLDELLQD